MINVINDFFSQIMLKKKHSFKFQISNNGQTGLTYSWFFNQKPVEQLFLISVDDGEFVSSMSCRYTFLYVEPVKYGTLQNFKMVLQVIKYYYL